MDVFDLTHCECVLCSLGQHMNLWCQAWISIKQMILVVIANIYGVLTMTWAFFFLSTLYVLTYLILNTMVWSICYYKYYHLTDKKTEASRS